MALPIDLELAQPVELADAEMAQVAGGAPDAPTEVALTNANPSASPEASRFGTVHSVGYGYRYGYRYY